MPELVQPLLAGPVDVIGDVHGEIEPLRQLLHRLGYGHDGRHGEGRRPVFVGDLVDRGPDSPAVLKLVRTLVAQGLAQCVIGNHELNLLRREPKSGNRWFLDPSHPEQLPSGEFAHSSTLRASEVPDSVQFLQSLPVALERQDLRIIHAAWHPEAIETLRLATTSAVQVYEHFERQTLIALEKSGLLAAALEEQRIWGPRLDDPTTQPPLLEAQARSDEHYQMGNPLRVLTSGVERMAAEPFWASGKWRMCDRQLWWRQYQENVPVIIGHYWRHPEISESRVFDNLPPKAWLGPNQNVFCVDFSIGGRYRERLAGVKQYRTRLAALRWPERELWFESGQLL